MIRIENVETYGWEAAIRGMRNPMNSWDKSDSQFEFDTYDCELESVSSKPCLCIGDNDLDLMKRLVKAGSDHRKFMRFITVTCDITAPLYWWKEFDTYKVGTVANSCSTMHKIHAKEFELDDFSHEHLDDDWSDKDNLVEYNSEYYNSPYDVFEWIVYALNIYRKRFLETHDKKYWWQMIQLLPSSYNQRRTVQMNYEVLRNMYHARKAHKLYEWRDFCKWVETLPYHELITDGGEKNGQSDTTE